MPGAQLSLAAALPFVGLLAAIAVVPLVAPSWWHSNRNKAIVAGLVSLPVLWQFGIALGEPGRAVLRENLAEYATFIIVIAALFVITGGIYIQGSLAGTPLVNTGVLGVGAVLANLLGTTGASVLLIRPLLRANKSRRRKAHIVVFFIFLVANCGGLLTPIGDPPLLLGFLNGVPFQWTLRLWPQWLAATVALLVVFNLWDQWVLDREERERPGSQLERVMVHEPLRVRGAAAVAALGGVLLTIIAAGQAAAGGRPWSPGIQEAVIAALALTTYGVSAGHRERNAFTFAPIAEVAILFAGIFVTMGPVLEILNAWSEGARTVLGLRFGVSHPAEFFWTAGALSSVLDNAPTYLAFTAAAAGLHGIPAHGPFAGALALFDATAARQLAAIATGAVFMGAMTYIGNAPNFMVKAIAEENGVRMPSFFGYMAYSCGILLPLFILITLIFF